MNNRQFYETEYITTVAIATGLSRRTVFKVQLDSNRVDPYIFDRTVMEIVHTFYERRDYLTLTAVYREAKEKGVFGWTVLFIEMFDADYIFKLNATHTNK